MGGCVSRGERKQELAISQRGVSDLVPKRVNTPLARRNTAPPSPKSRTGGHDHPTSPLRPAIFSDEETKARIKSIEEKIQKVILEYKEASLVIANEATISERCSPRKKENYELRIKACFSDALKKIMVDLRGLKSVFGKDLIEHYYLELRGHESRALKKLSPTSGPSHISGLFLPVEGGGSTVSVCSRRSSPSPCGSF